MPVVPRASNPNAAEEKINASTDDENCDEKREGLIYLAVFRESLHNQSAESASITPTIAKITESTQ